ncbi:hypothetical protein LUZ60_017049 [Juncus effusus]|nr:hypothetical protein LUZ60_017049 [Juncus effusus]
MEEMQIESPKIEIFTPKSDDLKYICSLSTILVATIQEVKDRVSQIELIFCSQLFPKFQSNSKSFLKKQDEWKEREGILLGQIEELKCDLGKEREKLVREIESKDQILAAEQRKRKDAVQEFGTLKERYKSLKSQYTFLIGKLENNSGNFKLPSQSIEEKNSLKSHSAKKSLQTEDFDEMETKETKFHINPESTSTPILPNPNSDREEKMQSARTKPPSSSKTKPDSITGQKRLATWRDTRAHQKPCGADPDPHDDFLDTPIESARKSRSNNKSETRTPLAQLHQDPCKKDGISLQDMNFDGSDEETQDLNNLNNLNNKITIQKKEEKGFKFVEPVRKKGERENLKGVECKQCKKFYDAVLPDGKENNNNVNNNNYVNTEGMRCEHHEGVSRHRYKYAPPLTPEGFWNIGFESEM